MYFVYFSLNQYMVYHYDEWSMGLFSGVGDREDTSLSLLDKKRI